MRKETIQVCLMTLGVLIILAGIGYLTAAATSTHTAIEPNTFERSQKFTITWGISTDVEELLNVIPLGFTPEGIDWYTWDSSQCYDDGEIISIIVSTFTPATAAGPGSISVYRDEIKANDGCESGATVEFVLVGQY